MLADIQAGDIAWVQHEQSLYVCTVATAGAAVWDPIAGGGHQTASGIPLTSFDPGSGNPRRWNAAFEAAMAQMAIAPFALLIDGAFVFTEKITIYSPAVVRGSGSVISRLSFTTVGNAGIMIAANSGGSSISGLTLVGPNPFVGHDNGITIKSALCSFTDLVINNWSLRGISAQASVPQSDANECTFQQITMNLCGHGGAPAGQPDETGAGIYLDSSDSNGNLLLKVQFFDCRKGAYDSSFLGNTFVSCSAEGCNNRFDVPTPNPIVGYGFGTDDPNAQSAFVGCYTENDSVCHINSPSVVFGGAVGNVGSALFISSQGAYPGIGGYSYDTKNGWTTKGTIGNDNLTNTVLAIEVRNTSNGTYVVLPTRMIYGRAGSGWWSWNYGALDEGDVFRFGGPQTNKDQFWVNKDLFLGDPPIRIGVYASLAAAISTGPRNGPPAWQVGDRVMVYQPQPGQPSSYCCTSASPLVFVVETTLGAAP